jgi:hypothetical protein
MVQSPKHPENEPHRQAADYHYLGQHEDAKKHAVAALEHSEAAYKHTTTAHGHSHK